MNRIDRLLGILTLLQTKKYVTAEAIADKFEISVRTVYRDIKALHEQGVPVSFEQHKGYFIVEGYFLPPVSFSSAEASALLLMETMVQGFADKSIGKHYTSALNKVKAVLRSSEKEAIDRLSQHTRFQFPACFIKDTAFLSILQQSIISKTILELEYSNTKNEVSSRRVEAIGLIFYAFAWHLIAWCHLRQDYRDFKVSRILKVKATSQGFQKQDHIALNEYMHALPVDY